MGGAEKWTVNLDDQVVRSSLILRDGELLWPPPKLEPPPPAKPAAVLTAVPELKPLPASKEKKARGSAVALVLTGLVVAAVGAVAPKEFLSHFTVFVLACFVGWQVIWNVTPALHTPLMSVTNAISGIIIVGGLLQLNAGFALPVTLIGTAAVLLATINIVGGFLVTQRMLRMFHR
jgi:NAD(P) transhydrogenase subunit alpha